MYYKCQIDEYFDMILNHPNSTGLKFHTISSFLIDSHDIFMFKCLIYYFLHEIRNSELNISTKIYLKYFGFESNHSIDNSMKITEKSLLALFVSSKKSLFIFKYLHQTGFLVIIDLLFKKTRIEIDSLFCVVQNGH